MGLPSMRAIFIVLAALAVGAMGIAILYLYNPAECTFYPQCPFFILTGLKCPGCGTARALHHILHGNIAEAFRYNPFLAFAMPVMLLFMLAPACRKGACWGWVYMAVAIAWWVGRNML